MAKCTINIILPEQPCDLYVEGTLMKSGVTSKVQMVTPNLPAGSFKYTMLLRDSADPTKTHEKVVTGIVAGGNITVDLRMPKEVAAL